MLLSMYVRAELERRDDRPREDHVVRLTGVGWADYERLLEIRGDRSAPRFTYLDGTLEIMSPSKDHEAIKSFVGRLVEAYCLHADIPFSPFGSWTLKDEPEQSGVEPDECYVFGEAPEAVRPDLAIEVIWTSGSLDKLEVYRRLSVPEVWTWRKGSIVVHALRKDRYVEVERSVALPGLDLDLLVEHLDRPTAYHAIRAFRAALEAKRGE
jgi:Uma2 family endonuclease